MNDEIESVDVSGAILDVIVTLCAVVILVAFLMEAIAP